MTTGSSGDHRLGTQTVVVVDELIARCAALELPAPSDMLLRLRNRLAEDSYYILVAGEAKVGKSRFINALLGEVVLPEAVEIATCQIFHVRSGQREAYRLRFEDGSAQEIQQSDLERYGSQVVADQGGGVRPQQNLLWIEVEVPARFVPERVAILDTPGLGAMSAAHAQITRRFVPQADAVLLILDSARPLGAREVELLEAILEVTSRVFCVQTKIDQHSREVWQQTQQRNEEILRERFADRLPDARVWPISSTNLLAAAHSDDSEALVFVSRYRQLAEALRAFLEDVCAAPRAAETLALTVRHHRAAGQVLAARLQSLTEQSSRQAAAYQEMIDKRWRQFQADWGDRGQKRKALQQSIRRVTALSKQGFREALAPGGFILRSQESRIQAVRSPDEANLLGKTLGGDLVAAVMDEWTRVCHLAGQQYGAIFVPFLQETDGLIAGPENEALEAASPDAHFQETPDRLYDRLRASYRHVTPVMAITGIVGSVLATPLVFAVAGAGILWTGLRGWTDARAAKTKAAQGELQRYLREVLQQVQQHFFSVDLAGGRFSRVDEYFNAAEANLNKQVHAVVQQRVAELRAELERLQAQASLGAKEQGEAVQRLRAAVADWERLGRRITELLNSGRSRAHLDDLAQRTAAASAMAAESAATAPAGTPTPAPS